jgi:hypothetical protein
MEPYLRLFHYSSFLLPSSYIFASLLFQHFLEKIFDMDENQGLHGNQNGQKLQFSVNLRFKIL